MNILVVDDDPGIVEILAEFLRELDYRVECAGNGVEALAWMEAKEFDLLLTDINMPVMGGMELIKRLNSREKPPVIIVITAYASMQSAIDAIKLGVYDYITKPFNFEIVRNAVEKALEKKFLERENINLKEMMALYRASESISSQFGLDEVVRVLFDSAASIAKADFMALYLDDASDSESVDLKLCRRQLLQRVSGADRAHLCFLPKKFSAAMVEEFIAGYSSRLFSENDSWLETFFGETNNSVNFNSMMVFSLRAHNRLVGILVLVSFTPNVIFTDSLRRSFYMLVSKAAAAIETTYLYDNLQRQYIETVESFAQALEEKDSYTHGHSRQVSLYALLLASSLAFSNDELAVLQQAAILHDIGKIGISETILNLSRQLTEKEVCEVREHPCKGRNILAPIRSLATVAEVVYYHHERWDGAGYPDGVKGVGIPLMARIVGLADAFDAMTSQRPYRSPLSLEMAFAELRKGAGRQFDPELVDLFVAQKNEIVKLLANRSARELLPLRRTTDQKRPARLVHNQEVASCG